MSNLSAKNNRKEHNERKIEILSLLNKTIKFYEKEKMEKSKNVFKKLGRVLKLKIGNIFNNYESIY